MRFAGEVLRLARTFAGGGFPGGVPDEVCRGRFSRVFSGKPVNACSRFP